MKKIVVRTKFNKTGRRVLTIPLDDRRVCARAYRLCREACRAAQGEWTRMRDSAEQTYVETMAHWIASYVARDSTPVGAKYRIAKFLAGQSLAQRGPVPIPGRVSSQRWSIQIGIPELSSVEEEAWEAYVVICHRADAEGDKVVEKARTDCDVMKRALWQEVYDHIGR